MPSQEDLNKPIEKLKKAREEDSSRNGPPIWGLRIFSWNWERKVSLFTFMKCLGKSKTLSMISDKFLRDQIKNPEHK